MTLRHVVNRGFECTGVNRTAGKLSAQYLGSISDLTLGYLCGWYSDMHIGVLSSVMCSRGHCRYGLKSRVLTQRWVRAPEDEPDMVRFARP
jgi:hypothetical protein